MISSPWSEENKKPQQHKWRNSSRMAICYCKRWKGEITPWPFWESHNEQGLYLLAKSTTVWVITPISFTQCQRRLPFEILTSSQIRTRLKYTCSVPWTGCPFPSPATNLSRSYTTVEISIPSPHHFKLSSHWKRKMVGNILGLNYVCPDFSLGLPAWPYKVVCATDYFILQIEISTPNCNKLLSAYGPSWAQAISKRANAYLTMPSITLYTNPNPSL